MTERLKTFEIMRLPVGARVLVAAHADERLPSYAEAIEAIGRNDLRTCAFIETIADGPHGVIARAEMTLDWVAVWPAPGTA